MMGRYGLVSFASSILGIWFVILSLTGEFESRG